MGISGSTGMGGVGNGRDGVGGSSKNKELLSWPSETGTFICDGQQ